MTIYRLGSSSMVSAPGVVRWAINGFHFPEDRDRLRDVIAKGWGVPDEVAVALLSRKVAYSVEGDPSTGSEVVVFTVEGGDVQRKRFVVTATYETPSGRKGKSQWRMASTWATIATDAERHVRSHRTVWRNLDIKAVCLD